jgi:hypothetical protein
MPEGYKLAKHEAAMYIEGPAKALMINETLLHFLTTGTRFRTLAADYPGSKYPWVFMGARYLAGDDLAIATRALSEEGILSTVPRWAERFIGTESHSQIAMWGGLRLSDEVEALISNETKDERVAATIRATIAFHLANPEVPLYVLGDFAARSTGCFEVFRATAADCAKLGIPLVGGRMDISKADLNDEPLVEPTVKPEYEKALAEAERQFKEACKQGYMDPGEQYLSALQDVKRKYAGMNLSVVRKVREQLDEAGLKEFKLVISSGI